MARAIAAVVAVIALVVGAIWLVRPKDDDDGHAAAKAWEARAREAFQPLVSNVQGLVQGAREWQAGERTTDVFTAQVDKSLVDFAQTRDRVAKLKPSPRAEQAGELYENSTQLYVEVGKIYQVMLGSQPGDVRTQLDLLARRVRELADRVYDRGHAAIAPYLDEQRPESVEIHLPEEVPIWQAEGLAAGPPLDDPPGPTAESPPLRQPTRPEQSASDWARDVSAAGIPSDSEFNAALAAVDGDRLRDIAGRFDAAAERLRARPDPKGGRERGAVFRLGLLVEEEAARAAQAASLVGDAPRDLLRQIAKGLALIGSDLTRETGP